jgi:hypothetical protein
MANVMQCTRDAEHTCASRNRLCNPETHRCVKPTTPLGKRLLRKDFAHVVEAMNEAVEEPRMSTIKKALMAIKSLAARHLGVLIIILVAIAATSWGVSTGKAQNLARIVIENTKIGIPQAYRDAKDYVEKTWSEMFIMYHRGKDNTVSKPSNLKPSGAKLSGAKLSGAKPSGAKPSGAKLSGAKPSNLKPSNLKPSNLKPPIVKPPIKVDIKEFSELAASPASKGLLASVFGRYWKVIAAFAAASFAATAFQSPQQVTEPLLNTYNESNYYRHPPYKPQYNFMSPLEKRYRAKLETPALEYGPTWWPTLDPKYENYNSTIHLDVPNKNKNINKYNDDLNQLRELSNRNKNKSHRAHSWTTTQINSISSR